MGFCVKIQRRSTDRQPICFSIKARSERCQYLGTRDAILWEAIVRGKMRLLVTDLFGRPLLT